MCRSVRRTNRHDFIFLRNGNAARKGVVSVEFALVFPIVLAFFIAMISFTRLVTLRDSVQHAAYEGAREGMLLESTNQDCVEKVEEFLGRVHLYGAEIEVLPAGIEMTTEEITVSVTVPMSENAWIGGGFVDADWTVSESVTLSRYRKNDD